MGGLEEGRCAKGGFPEEVTPEELGVPPERRSRVQAGPGVSSDGGPRAPGPAGEAPLRVCLCVPVPVVHAHVPARVSPCKHACAFVTLCVCWALGTQGPAQAPGRSALLTPRKPQLGQSLQPKRRRGPSPGRPAGGLSSGWVQGAGQETPLCPGLLLQASPACASGHLCKMRLLCHDHLMEGRAPGCWR